MSVQEFNGVTKGGFYCENPDSTKKQEVDVLLFWLISLVKRFYFFIFNIQNISSWVKNILEKTGNVMNNVDIFHTVFNVCFCLFSHIRNGL